MNKQLNLFYFFLAVIVIPALCQASTTILSNTSPNHTVLSGSNEKVYGTSASNQITLESGAKAALINFPGQNTLQVQSSSDMFTVSRSGTVVTFQGSDETILKIPVSKDAQTISFNGEETRVLQIYNNQVLLDDQVITITPASIDGGSEDPGQCGAYIAPGVWKEFDCYNLAAIGKTTGDDPFTPSWRLIGGYWQWGRKGPDSSQWYDTNTPNFAHGPTGPDSWETNSGSIIKEWWDGWDYSNAPNGAWSDTMKTANDPCPAGYRLPTKVQWDGVRDNNNQSTVGTWSNNATNYSSARSFGDKLLLPAAGFRGLNSSGALANRGNFGKYWSSSDYSSSHAWFLHFTISGVHSYSSDHRSGLSVRCISK